MVVEVVGGVVVVVVVVGSCTTSPLSSPELEDDGAFCLLCLEPMLKNSEIP